MSTIHDHNNCHGNSDIHSNCHSNSDKGSQGYSHVHGHHHHHGAHTVNTVFKVAIVLNMAFVAVEFVAGFMADSVGLMSDAGHNLSDVLSLAVAWVAVLASSRKATVVASAINSALLLAAVAVIIGESIGKLVHPQEVDGTTMMVVAAIGVAVNLTTALMLHRKDDGDLNVRGAFLHMVADTLVSVGVVVSGWVIVHTGWHLIDPVVGLVVGIVVLVMTVDYIMDVIAASRRDRAR